LSSATIETVVKSARFERVGGLVTAFFDISVRAIPASMEPGPLFLDGLPLVSRDDPGTVGGATVYYHSHFRSGIHHITGTVSGNSQRVQLWRSAGVGLWLNHLVSSDLQNISAFSGCIQYSTVLTSH